MTPAIIIGMIVTAIAIAIRADQNRLIALKIAEQLQAQLDEARTMLREHEARAIEQARHTVAAPRCTEQQLARLGIDGITWWRKVGLWWVPIFATIRSVKPTFVGLKTERMRP